MRVRGAGRGGKWCKGGMGGYRVVVARDSWGWVVVSEGGWGRVRMGRIGMGGGGSGWY